jgi:SsrA-binding protein
MKIITQNKKAFFDYHIIEKIEAGIVLFGDEVKSIRAGHMNLTGSFAVINAGELWLLNASISAYSHSYKKDTDTNRTRKLLVKKRELMVMIGDIARKGITVIPLKVYLNDKGKVKIELGIAKHKNAASKKQSIMERDIKRETSRELKNIDRY